MVLEVVTMQVCRMPAEMETALAPAATTDVEEGSSSSPMLLVWPRPSWP
jgi:hypothetical protein